MEPKQPQEIKEIPPQVQQECPQCPFKAKIKSFQDSLTEEQNQLINDIINLVKEKKSCKRIVCSCSPGCNCNIECPCCTDGECECKGIPKKANKERKDVMKCYFRMLLDEHCGCCNKDCGKQFVKCLSKKLDCEKKFGNFCIPHPCFEVKYYRKNVAAMDNNVYAIDNNVYAIDNNVYAIDNNVYAIDNNVYAMENNAHAIDNNAYAMDNNAYALDNNAYAMDNNVVVKNKNLANERGID